MKTLLFITLISSISVSFSQTFEVEQTSGKAEYISGNETQWSELKKGMLIKPNTIIATSGNSFVKLKNDDLIFTLSESSAIAVSNIKKMTLDELVLALAMEDIINTPRKGGGNKSTNTAVYGSKLNDPESKIEPESAFGLKRLNGARQLAENGMEEAAIITALEVYRKYPSTISDAKMRIFFAELLFEKGLYEEAYNQYSDIKSLELTAYQASLVSDKIDVISRKLMNR